MPRHDLDALSLVAGVVFGGLALCSLMQTGPGVPARWVAPVLLILAGLVGLIAIGRGRRE